MQGFFDSNPSQRERFIAQDDKAFCGATLRMIKAFWDAADPALCWVLIPSLQQSLPFVPAAGFLPVPPAGFIFRLYIRLYIKSHYEDWHHRIAAGRQEFFIPHAYQGASVGARLRESAGGSRGRGEGARRPAGPIGVALSSEKADARVGGVR